MLHMEHVLMGLTTLWPACWEHNLASLAPGPCTFEPQVTQAQDVGSVGDSRPGLFKHMLHIRNGAFVFAAFMIMLWHLISCNTHYKSY